MVVLNKIYTRTGDDGTTALGSGERRAKHDLRVAAYGTVDEANATLGLVRLHLEGMPDLDQAMAHIQNDLFDLGADLATPETDEPLPYEPLRITDDQVKKLETEIDRLNGDLQPLRSFVLPAGAPGAAYLHLARTVARRAERLISELSGYEKVNGAALRYANRLSDFLFVAARWVNAQDEGDVLWVPGENR
ncbi:ATP:cob(I)alamin adenosyltransferase [Breoghania corrubedonensis]|uniref:Corrinoid adenosyltransferase n=1 Tax=Breoghania corrubedonensis TaxID=665038 RepID=A0A2T5VII0_9HYPH|nr:cob(I)yrinic acid a,c-diamide adenosyltransferase [Breoghania corrubedonensis]PTW63518.1 ATP:cob(I)alamin adenosyltransferase [Breoghania corrubedonensis]